MSLALRSDAKCREPPAPEPGFAFDRLGSFSLSADKFLSAYSPFSRRTSEGNARERSGFSHLGYGTRPVGRPDRATLRQCSSSTLFQQVHLGTQPSTQRTRRICAPYAEVRALPAYQGRALTQARPPESRRQFLGSRMQPRSPASAPLGADGRLDLLTVLLFWLFFHPKRDGRQMA